MDRKKVEKDVEKFWRHRYAIQFMNKDAEQYASVFALPCIIRAEDIPRTIFTERQDLIKYCKSLIEKAKSTTWETSTIDSLKIQVLEENVATVAVVASRFNAAGEKISRLYGSYTVNKEDDVWKMAAIFGGFLPD